MLIIGNTLSINDNHRHQNGWWWWCSPNDSNSSCTYLYAGWYTYIHMWIGIVWRSSLGRWILGGLPYGIASLSWVVLHWGSFQGNISKLFKDAERYVSSVRVNWKSDNIRSSAATTRTSSSSISPSSLSVCVYQNKNNWGEDLCSDIFQYPLLQVFA